MSGSKGSVFRSSLAALSMLAFAATLAVPAAAQNQKFFRIASGSTGGTFFPMAGILANAISNPPGSRPCNKGGSCGVPGLIAIAQSANGSVANVNAVESGNIESALVTSSVAGWAYAGTGLFAGKPKMKKLRAIATLFPEHFQVVVPKGSPVKSIHDLKGRKISAGGQGSAGNASMNLIFGLAGIDVAKDIRVEYMGFSQAANHLRDGQLDAIITLSGYPTGAVSQVATTIGARLLPIPADVIKKVVQEAPSFAPGVVPGGTYEGLNEDVATLAAGAQWITNESTDAGFVYELTKALWNKKTKKLFRNGHAKGKAVSIETAMDGIGIPLHPGAVRFYKEHGIKTPAIN